MMYAKQIKVSRLVIGQPMVFKYALQDFERELKKLGYATVRSWSQENIETILDPEAGYTLYAEVRGA